MWLEQISRLESINETSIKSYLETVSNSFNFKIISFEKLEKKLLKQEGDLFSDIFIVKEFFNHKNVSYFISFFNHYFKLNYHHLSSYEIITDYSMLITDFFSTKISQFFLIKPDKILSKKDNSIIFLILFFNPVSNKFSMLYHEQKKIPLICCSDINMENFNMLLYLMKKYAPQEVNLLTQGYNLNHILVEELIKSHNYDYTIIKKKINIEKIQRFWDLKCSFKNFVAFSERRGFDVEQDFVNYLINLEITYFKDKLNNSLTEKYDYKLVKI